MPLFERKAISERHNQTPSERVKTAATGAMSVAKSQTTGEAEENPSPSGVDARTVEGIVADKQGIVLLAVVAVVVVTHMALVAHAFVS